MSETAPVFTGYYPYNGIPHTPPGAEDFEHIASLEGYEYEWDQIDFWYSPSKRRYFWYEQSGCSCNGPFEGHYATLGDFDSGLYADAVKEVLNWESSFWYGTKEEQKNRALSALQKHNAKLRREAPTFI